jgi:hypothetical protein
VKIINADLFNHNPNLPISASHPPFSGHRLALGQLLQSPHKLSDNLVSNSVIGRLGAMLIAQEYPWRYLRIRLADPQQVPQQVPQRHRRINDDRIARAFRIDIDRYPTAGATPRRSRYQAD